jgi:hypothetical protein
MDETALFMEETAHFMDENVTFQSYGSKGHFMDETAIPGVSGRSCRMSLIWRATYSFNIILALSYIVVGIVNQHLSPDY